jgi:hypothetical protein
MKLYARLEIPALLNPEQRLLALTIDEMAVGMSGWLMTNDGLRLTLTITEDD